MSWKTLSVSYMIANLFHLTGLLFVITCIFLCLSHAHSQSPSSIPNSILTDFNFPACFVAKRSILLRLKCKHRKRDRDREGDIGHTELWPQTTHYASPSFATQNPRITNSIFACIRCNSVSCSFVGQLLIVHCP